MPTKILVRFPASDDVLARFRAAAPSATIVPCSTEEALLDHLDAAVIIGGVAPPAAGLKSFPDLRWIQALSVGIDGFDLAAMRESGVVLTNSRSVNVINLAEHALALMLCFARGLPELAARQARREWTSQDERPALFELSGQSLLIAGYGAFGKAVATRALAFGMDVIGVSRTGTGSHDELGVARNGIDAIDSLLPKADHLLLAMPLTAGTRGFLDAARIALLRPSAYVYNLGRGELIDHEALGEALLNGRLAGAGLDVTVPEPLPLESPLWTLPNTIVTSHTAGLTPRFLPRVIDFIVGNLERFVEGGELQNVIDFDEGY